MISGEMNLSELYKNLLDDLEDQCWTMLDAETYGFVNKSHAKFMGKKQEEVSFKKLSEVLKEPELSFCIQSNEEVITTKKKTVGQYWIKNKVDELRLLKFEKTPYIEDDEIKYILCKCKDITKDFNRSLISEEQYRDVVEVQPHLVFRFEPDYHITFLNTTYCKNFDIDCKKKMIGCNFLSHVPQGEHDGIISYFNTFSLDNPIQSHYHSLTYNGEITYVRWYDRAFFNEQGDIIEFQSIGVVVPDYEETSDNEKLKPKQNQKISKIKLSLLESNKRYESLLELVPDSVIIYTNQKIVYANSALVKMLGLSSEKQLLGQPIEKYLPSKEKERANYYIEQLLLGSVFPLIEFEIVSEEGKKIYAEIASTVINYKGKKSVLNIIRDTTERKMHERLKEIVEEEEKLLLQAQEHDQLRTEFFSNISHELRTPLNLILSTIQLLEFQHKKHNKCHDSKYFDILKHNCYRLLKLINNLIDITKIDSGYVDTSIGNYDIIKLVEGLLETAHPYVASKELKMNYQSSIEQKLIACDPEKIERILLNLISNAVKFTDVGGEISVLIDETQREVCITVEDTGIGIAPENQDIIFERFRQIDKSFTRCHEGSGIGLAITKALVEMQKGHISLKSQVGKGSKFVVGLPNTQVIDEPNEQIYSKSHTMEKINIEFSDI